MLVFVRQRAEGRLLRLFGCNCCRRIWHLLPDERSRRAVEVRELFEQGKTTESELDEVRRCADAARAEARAPFRFARCVDEKSPRGAAPWAAGAAFSATRGLYDIAAEFAANAAACASSKGWDLGLADERRAQCDLLREMVAPAPAERTD